MSRITTASTGLTEISSWAKAHHEQVQDHLAWHGEVDPVQAESLLEGEVPFTYFLRKESGNGYFISFVKGDRSIKHQHFTLELDSRGWYFKNGTQDSPREVIADTLESLISQVMQCRTKEVKILDTSKRKSPI